MTISETRGKGKGGHDDGGAAPLPPRLDVVVLGPPGSGKTAFVAAAALGHADRPGSPVTRCLARGDGNRLLLETLRKLGAGEELTEPTKAPRTVNLGVELTGSTGSLDLLLHDFPGAITCPEAREAGLDPRWHEKAQRATGLLVFLDCLTPRSFLLQLALRRIQEDLMQPVEIRRRSPLLGGRVDGPPATPLLRLPFQRVLLVVSRVDRLYQELLEGGRPVPGKPPGAPGIRTAADLARRIDPRAQALSLLGRSSLSLLLSSLPPGGRMAAVAVSAGGFTRPDGHPFLDRNGRPTTAAGDAWHPRGVRQALDFLVAGATAGPVVPLTRRDLSNRFVRVA